MVDVPFDPQDAAEGSAVDDIFLELEGETAKSKLSGYITQKYQCASDDRYTTEQIWLRNYWTYRGEYSPEERAKFEQAIQRNQFTSQAYVKIGKSKTQAAYGQICEVLFGTGGFPIGVDSTPVPDNVPENAYVIPDELKDVSSSPMDMNLVGYAGDGMELPDGATTKDVNNIWHKFKGMMNGKSLKEGVSPDRTQLPQINPAKDAAHKMEKQIHDQLKEAEAETAIRRAALEACIYGTCAIKGPFNRIVTLNKWEKDGESGEMIYSPEQKLIPDLAHVSIWDLYVDPNAATVDEAEFIVQRHDLNQSQVRQLVNYPGFDEEAIKQVIKHASAYDREYWEEIIKDNSSTEDKGRYRILEYWGAIDTELADSLELEYTDDDTFLDTVQINAWICNGIVLKASLNPFTPMRLPYFVTPYEEHPHQIWGIGVPENMQDTQDIMNVHMRMSIDNLMLAGSVMLEVNENQLDPSQTYEFYPGKVFRRVSGAPGQSIYSINVQNTAPQHMQMFDVARRLADEATGIPSFSHGQTGVSGVGRTAGGISMLMGAAALNVKTVVRNFDQYMLRPLGEALFNWNMRYNSDKVELIGDLKIVARGTSALMQKEVQSQRLLQFAQVWAGNPATAPFVNLNYILKESAKAMELDPDNIVNDPDTARLYMEMVQSQQGGQQNAPQPRNTPQGQAPAPQGPQGGGSTPGPMGGVNPADTSGVGGGTIGVGVPPSQG